MRIAPLRRASGAVGLVLALGCSSSTSRSQSAFDKQNVARFMPQGPDTACVFDVQSGQSGNGTYVMRVRRHQEQSLELEVAGRVQRWHVEEGAITGGDGEFLLVAPLEPSAKWQGVEGSVELVDTDVELSTPARKLRGCIRTREVRRKAQDIETIHTVFCPNLGPTAIEVERKTNEGKLVTEKAVLRYCRDVSPFQPRAAEEERTSG
jgi:hypothetical protein